MRDAYQVTKIRAAEGALMSILEEGALMRRAAAGLASVCARLLAESGGVYGARVTVLAGTGDNGGDALYAASRLARRGAAVIAIGTGSRLHEAGAAALRAAGGRVIGVADDLEVRKAIGHCDLIVDGMLGIGGKGGLREPQATLAKQASLAAATVVAVDLPSGIDADTGAVAGPAIRADVTVTFGALKPGLLIDPAAAYAGVVELVDIGLGPHLLDPPDATSPQHADIAALLPYPTGESDKYQRGVLGLLAGSDRFTGAVVLSTGGAVHGGAGMIRVVTAPAAADLVRSAWPEAVLTVLPEVAGAAQPGAGPKPGGRAGTAGPDGTRGGADVPGSASGRGGADVPGSASGQGGADATRPAAATRPAGAEGGGSGGADPARSVNPDFPANVGRVQAWVAGPGMGTGADAAARLAAVLGTSLPVLVDADGLTLLSQRPDLLPRPAPTLLTPHAGELGRLLGADPADVAARRFEHARAAAAKFGACVLLKGSTTVIAPPDGRDPVLVNPTGSSWLATAGTGDVLSGLAGALLAQGLLPPQAALAAAYLHGLAARLAASPDLTRPQAPIGASDLVRALPLAYRSVALAGVRWREWPIDAI